jgi:hypothetical protein
MTATRRVFVLLGAYEDITERESGALRRGDIDYAISLENRKQRISAALADARRNTVLSGGDLDVLTRRVRSLETREKDNLAFLREEMARVRESLTHLQQAAHRNRQVRRGYAGGTPGVVALAESVLGRA